MWLKLSILSSISSVCVLGNCEVFDTKVGASYDLSELHGDYRIVDSDPTVAYEYIFSVCRDIDATYLASQTSACVGDTAPGYQIDSDDSSKCHALGGTYESPLNYNWKLHDENDPAGGVVLQYLNGDSCYTTGSKRKLDLHFICRDSAGKASNFPDTEFVEEPNTCEYELNLYTGLACPRECPRDETKGVCNGQGVCGYDNVLKKAKCFCDEGHTGDACENDGTSSASNSASTPSSSSSGTDAALVVVCLLLVGVLGMAGYMWSKLRKLQLDPDAYSQLGNRFNELGQVAEE